MTSRMRPVGPAHAAANRRSRAHGQDGRWRAVLALVMGLAISGVQAPAASAGSSALTGGRSAARSPDATPVGTAGRRSATPAGRSPTARTVTDAVARTSRVLVRWSATAADDPAEAADAIAAVGRSGL